MTTNLYTVDVQFKWGKVGEFGSKDPLENGAHVLVEAEKGIDMGMVVGCEKGSTPGGKVVHREGSVEEVGYWRGKLADEDAKAKKEAAKLLPENATNIRVLRCAYQFDKSHLLLQYECNGTPNHSSYVPKLQAHFSPCKITVEEITSVLPTVAPLNEDLGKHLTKPGNFHCRGESIDSVLSSNGLSSVASEYDYSSYDPGY